MASTQYSDPYALSAEFYDVLSEQQWLKRRDSISAALQEIDPQGLILDVGAGTGPCVQVIADALPQARILAVEPSAAMRAALLGRLMRSADLRQRVTVLAGTLEQVTLPPQLSAAVICGTLGYLDVLQRQCLWQQLSERLDERGIVIVDVMMLDTPQPVPLMQVACAEIGEHLYRVFLQGEPAGGDLMHWTLDYQVLAGNSVVRRFSAKHDWHTFGLEQVAQEAGVAGFVLEPLGDALIPAAVLRRRPHS
ncbi:class I SAM-dependent methyltransferase [Pseudomonas sp. RW407]|uniref:class I SAM-dependent methyltransferase n=1 Tax=Pseudomonas sp. RW407 TaxID=2202894 RepID=UPI000D6F6FB2|nr:class I SAM-dependent methyltransferase [Pseudomonas sp. RW407]PWU30666.1 class I SAM-dependent methyltransferase [Pseudomonas sp. RW407]